MNNLKLLRSKGELDLDNKLEMCNKCCKYKSSLNENGVCKECEEISEVRCECFDCEKEIKSVEKHCEECGVTLCESCYENRERGICEECEYEFDGMC